MDGIELRGVILCAIYDWYDSEPAKFVMTEAQRIDLARVIAARLEEGEERWNTN